jgi:hypothetical protein
MANSRSKLSVLAKDKSTETVLGIKEKTLKTIQTSRLKIPIAM